MQRQEQRLPSGIGAAVHQLAVRRVAGYVGCAVGDLNKLGESGPSNGRVISAKGERGALEEPLSTRAPTTHPSQPCQKKAPGRARALSVPDTPPISWQNLGGQSMP